MYQSFKDRAGNQFYICYFHETNIQLLQYDLHLRGLNIIVPILMLQQEHFFNCPYCNAEISVILDVSVQQQTYIEDCEVCCNPISINYKLEGETLIEFNAESIEQ